MLIHIFSIWRQQTKKVIHLAQNTLNFIIIGKDWGWKIFSLKINWTPFPSPETNWVINMEKKTLGIINVTNDSFSGDGILHSKNLLDQKFDFALKNNINLICTSSHVLHSNLIFHNWSKYTQILKFSFLCLI